MGSLWYADVIALLVPSPSALYILLQECEVFANLVFKTQLICFQSNPNLTFPSSIFHHFGKGFQDSVLHLGQIHQCNLSDNADIKSVSIDVQKGQINFLARVVILLF